MASLEYWLWLLAYGAILFLVVYLLLFPVYFWLCRLRGPGAIAWAWTTGILGFILFLCLASPQHAAYLIPGAWSVEAWTNFLVLAVPALVFLIFLVWAPCGRGSGSAIHREA